MKRDLEPSKRDSETEESRAGIGWLGVEGEKGKRRGFAAGNGLWARGEICRRMEGGGGIKGTGVKGNGGMGDR